MIKPIKIRWSEFYFYKPIECYIINPRMGKVKKVMNNYFVTFNAYILIGKQRQFELVVPYYKICNALDKFPIDIKNSSLIKVILQKERFGKINILKMEKVEENGKKEMQ